MKSEEFHEHMTIFLQSSIYLDDASGDVFNNIYNMILAITNSTLTDCVDGVISVKPAYEMSWENIYFLTDMYHYLSINGCVDYINNYMSIYFDTIKNTFEVVNAVKDTIVRDIPTDNIRICYLALVIYSRRIKSSDVIVSLRDRVKRPTL